jgi:hypothetical protein
LFACICAAPWIVTQTARSALPSPLSSKRAQPSPVLLPDQKVSSKFQVMAVFDPPQLPTTQNWFRSF